jgi:hypothetical protein
MSSEKFSDLGVLERLIDQGRIGARGAHPQ